MNSHQTDWEKNIIDNADSYSIMEWRPLGKSTKTIVNPHLVSKLKELELWDDVMINDLKQIGRAHEIGRAHV